MQIYLQRSKRLLFVAVRHFLFASIIICLLPDMLFAGNNRGQQLKTATISISISNKTITQVLAEIQAKTKLRFVYNPDELGDDKVFNIGQYKNEKVIDILKNLGYECVEDGKNVIVRKSRDNVKSATIKVTGTVRDTAGVTLVGVSVKIKDRPGGTSTDVNGNYVINTPDNGTLVFTYVGFRTIEVPVNGRRTVDIVLHAADSYLEEVTVVGFGVQKKISLVGSQAAINVKDLKTPVSNLTASLGGRVSGLVSIQKSGELGFNDANIYIRGISTFTSSFSAPLTLVDGVPRDIANIDPEDIESFSILKDASATAVYGVRGANGVILINTKSGKAGKPTYSFRYTEGITEFTQVPSMADGPTYMRMSNEAVTTRGGTPVYSDDVIEMTQKGNDPYLYPNVDWFSEVFNKTGHTRTANANINGGSANAIYYVGLGYYDELGLYNTDVLTQYNSSIYLKRYNVTSNLSLTPSKTTTIKVGIQGYLTNVNYPAASVGDIFSDAFFMTPVSVAVRYPDGKVGDIRAGSLSNPWASLTQTGYANQWRSQVYSNLRVTQELPFITKGLSASALFSFDAYNYTSNRYTKTPDTWLATGRDANGNLLFDQTRIGTEYLAYGKSNNGTRTLYTEGSLNYTRDFGKHNVGGMLLYNQSDRINTYASDLETSLPYRFRGLAGRFTYGYNNRYFAEFNFGYNGSENFYPDKRYGFFPSAGLGWVVSEEKFYAPLKDAVQFFKLRFSHGIVGNSNIDGRRFAYLATVASPSGYTFGQNMNNSFSGSEIDEYAVDVQWETARKTNLGIDLRFLNDKFGIQADIFKEHRSGIFLRRKSLPAYVGVINAPFGNVGIIDNRGIDGSLNYDARMGNVSLQLLGNFTYNRNKVVENDDPSWKYPWLERKGRKVSQRYGYVALGLFGSDEEVLNSPRQTGDVRAGDIKFKDINADGVIDSYDQVPIGYGNTPEIMYGFGFTLGYKSFGLSTLFQGAANVDFMLNGEGIAPFSQGLSRGNLFDNITDRWTVENPDPNAFYPRLMAGALNDNYAASTWWLKNANYLRLKTIQLSYTLPKKWVERVNFKSANIYLQGINVLTFSPFKLWDVELGDGRGASYPNTTSYNAGITLNF